MSQLTILNAKQEILNAEKDFISVSESTLNFQKEFQFAMQALGNNKFLLEIALSDPQSLKNAIVNVGAIGLSLNPAERLCYLVPMDGKVQLQVGYIGFLKLGVKDGGITWAWAEVVREKDIFTITGVDTKPIHSFDPFDKNRGSVKGVFCTAKTHDGSFLTRFMAYDECIAIRNRTKMWMKSPGKGPWQSDENEMIKKTVIKQASKTWPKGANSRLEKAIDVVNDFEGIDFERKVINLKENDTTKMLSASLKSSQLIHQDANCEAVITSIKSICSQRCQEMNIDEKRSFIKSVLGVESFNNLYNQNYSQLIELEKFLLQDDIFPKWED